MARPIAAGRRRAAVLPPSHQRRLLAARWQRGAIFLVMLIVIAVMGVGLAATGTLWHTEQQRDKEAELLFIGMQYRKAIRRYYIESPQVNRYPPTLDALLQDDRMPGVKRHLRRRYPDPLSNSPDWGLVAAPGGGIMGVYSLAPGTPIKQANFPPELGWPKGQPSYADWRFIYLPPGGEIGF